MNDFPVQLRWRDFFRFLGLFFGLSFLVSSILIMISKVIHLFAEKATPWIEIEGYLWLWFDAVVFFSLLLADQRIRQFMWQAFDFSVMRKPRTYGLILVSIALFYYVQTITIQYIGVDDASKQPEQLGFDAIVEGPRWLTGLILFISIAILTPVKEEMLFRGLIHRFLETRYHFWVGFIVSSFVFGFMHFEFPVSAIAMGMILVLLYRFTHSLVPSIVLHIVWNALVTLLFVINID